jgi:uncharacterized protein (TIGR02646 family)
MIRIRSRRLPIEARSGLDRYQAHVNSASTYEGRVERAKAHFKACNRRTDPIFKVVREVLDAMCRGPRRCMYCEDAPADEIEHFKPKDLQPELAFAWTNYLYACGPCNGPKNNRFAVITSGTAPKLIDATRKRGDPVIPPPRGKPALINPLKEDPLQFFQLDLRDTFIFAPTAQAGSIDYLRAEYTLDVLHLNDRDYLIHARNRAFEAFAAIVYEYLGERNTGVSNKTLSRFPNAIRRSHHQTVWAEMKRQHAVIPSIRSRFLEAPEVLCW